MRDYALSRRTWRVSYSWLAALLLIAAAAPVRGEAPDPRYRALIAWLEPLIQQEIEQKQLPALSIALVDDQKIVYAKGFGMADPKNNQPATENTVYRVGSLSKLFTDIALMQLVEQNNITLDAPVTKFLPDFRPKNPFGKAITLRQLMCHRSGLVREPPVGNYFDPTEPTLAATVSSVNSTALVYEPESRAKYSNAAIAVVGSVVERWTEKPLARHVQEAVLDPMGMTHSSFELTPALRPRLAHALMWSYDGREFPAPIFQFGIAPAGNLYSTVTDLGRFMTVLFRHGWTQGGQILKPATLEQMWTPQFVEPGTKRGFGLGFFLAEIGGQRAVGHGGAVYGFATQIWALPDAKLGAVVVTSVDIANTVVERVSSLALEAMLAQRSEKPLPTWERSQPLEPSLARRLDGTYTNGKVSVELIERNGSLYLQKGETRDIVRAVAGGLITDGRLSHGTRLETSGDQVLVDGETYGRQPDRKPDPAPGRWNGLIGEYGWDHNVLFIFEKDQQLHALIEWAFLYPLTELGPDEFAFPDDGLYLGEKIVFERDSEGRAKTAVAASIRFARRRIGTEQGETFRVEPVRPMNELRRAALAARPPAQPEGLLKPELVELVSLDPTIRVDVRYATTNNFLGSVFYPVAKALLQRPAAEAVARAHVRLKQRGYGLLIHDAYRPWYVTKMFSDATPASMQHFVANPAKGSVHNRGAAVDLTLYEIESGKPVEMVGGYDEFSERSYPDYMGGTSLQRWHRELLRDAMEAEGFTVYRYEWWHFDYKDAARYPVLNLPLEKAGSDQ